MLIGERPGTTPRIDVDVRLGWRNVAAVVLLLAACKEPAKPTPQAPAARGPLVRATVIDIKTTVEPSKRTSTHSIAIGDGVARSLAESQTWHLYDLNHGRVVLVNDVERTFRSDAVPSLLQRRRTQLTDDVDLSIPRAEYAVSNESRTILGIPARQSTVRMGEYVRQMWIASHPQIPAQLFSMLHASEDPSPLAPLARNAEEALLSLRGFPLEDHAEIAYGKKKLVVDRVVTAVRQAELPASLFQIPSGYKQLQPLPPVKAVRRPARAVAETPIVVTTETVAPIPEPAPVVEKPAPAPAAVKKPAAPAKKKPAVTKKAPVKKKPTVTKKAPVKKKPTVTKKKPTAVKKKTTPAKKKTAPKKKKS
jgi:hypothetical protein